MAARIFYYLSTGIILIGLALAAYSPDLFQWETLEWVYQKRTFFLFSLIFIISVILIYLIYWKAKKGILHSKSKTEIHLQESLNELVEDNQSLFSFLKAATESLGKQIETSKQNLSPEFFSACSTEYLKLTREFETSSEIFKSIPMAPEEDPKKNKINFKIYEYSEIINRHRKLSKNLEKLREDLTRLRNKVSR
ncbi:hypothetical protein GS518_02030 [Leptospira interrogans]|uniref:Uncharacterized protein n=6 Tax=Leptospira interrogans TaxID=173 RepID=A0A829D8S9_LEPIR|nr:hypothetical protein [Leptospira interrogans]APH40386.1 Uncharacterized protein A9P81_0432 [Leptospira interrogans serovar Copenhageni/Icterohaemorrhagiae]EMG24181.1 hypothetical protein LEP1GSC150_4511 [Leptospira interrogans serovar Copenhageni str. LT2050]EMY04781.1 hypothetical protein LEP1GSC029_2044 [Leptospira interrogans str. 2002000626]EMY23270.1 hypothetical protein LEP1GSC115_5069 [Leptospira interrogans serovar Australis str. 200703203]OCC30682.1 Uncharacterized protein GNX_0845